jgi:drug/metabolite transporter (DMT)-like permease
MADAPATTVVTNTTARREHQDLAALAAGLVTVVLWGSAFVGIRAADESFSPGAIALGRLIVSTAILSGVALARRERLPRPRDLVAIASYGVLWLGVYSFTLNAAERSVGAGTAAMIVNTGPLLIAILAGTFLAEGFPRGLLTGCLIALAGCAMISFAAITSQGRSGVGIVLSFVAAVAYASAVIVQKPVLARVSPFQVTWLGCLAATVACLPFGYELASDIPKAGGAQIGWVVYLGIGPTAVGFATWAFALRRASAGRTGALNYLIPLVAILLGWVVLGEKPSWLAVAGGAVCVGGVYLARRISGAAQIPSRRPAASDT